MARIIIVSNRLPVSARIERGELVVSQGAGGVASGLADIHERSNSVWIGWPGDTWRLPESRRAALHERLAALRCVPVELAAREARAYYEGFANGILWPVLHYQLDRLPTQPSGWDAYRRVNERFAEAVIEQYRPGDLVWVHDYQLMLVPGLVRRALPDAAIGFFLHVPFPSSELFRVPHWRRELLEGILGATLVGFHTASYADHFVSSTAKILGCPTGEGRITFEGRRVRVADLPMGIDAARYAAIAEQPSVQSDVGRLHRSAGGAQLLVPSTASTTRRASPIGCSRSNACSRPIPSSGTGSASSRSPPRRVSVSARTGTCGARSRASSAGSTAGSRRSAMIRSSTPRGRSRRSGSWPSTGRPRSRWSRRSATA